MVNTQENSISYRPLGFEDIEEIVSLENAIWSSSLRADKKLIHQRLTWRHTMLGAFRGNQLVGMACWRYGQFSPADTTAMPKDFHQFANRENQSPHNAAFVYNFALQSEIRNSKIGPQLIAKGIQILLDNQCDYLVGASRCPGYTLNSTPTLYQAINDYPARPIPWQLDPVLNFYSRALHCTFTCPLVNFLPEDIESGGYAIGFYKRVSS